jgi:hypothetical protein
MFLRGFVKIIYWEMSGRKWYRHHGRGIKLDNDIAFKLTIVEPGKPLEDGLRTD